MTNISTEDMGQLLYSNQLAQKAQDASGGEAQAALSTPERGDDLQSPEPLLSPSSDDEEDEVAAVVDAQETDANSDSDEAETDTGSPQGISPPAGQSDVLQPRLRRTVLNISTISSQRSRRIPYFSRRNHALDSISGPETSGATSNTRENQRLVQGMRFVYALQSRENQATPWIQRDVSITAPSTSTPASQNGLEDMDYSNSSGNPDGGS